MHTSFTTFCFSARAYSRVFVAALAVLISGCAGAITKPDNGDPTPPVADGDHYDCLDPGVAGPQLASICVVFDVDGCPVYTVYAGTLNALPELKRGAGQDGVNKLRWQAVQLQPGRKYSEIDAEYRIFFDPFQGAPIKSNGHKGQATSMPLGCVGDCELPGGVEFKYTIQAEPPTACAPLDPMVRVN